MQAAFSGGEFTKRSVARPRRIIADRFHQERDVFQLVPPGMTDRAMRARNAPTALSSRPWVLSTVTPLSEHVTDPGLSSMQCVCVCVCVCESVSARERE